MRQSDGGALSVGGCNPQSDGRQLRQILGVQLQSSSLPEGIRPGEAMALICAWHGLSPRFDILKRFGLDAQSKKQYREMSTGQKRRLHLALALASDPTVVVLDEPTAGLDVQGRMQLHNAIRELKATGVTIPLATHDMAEAESLCDRIAIIIRGRIAATGTPAQITSAGHSETRITLRTKRNCLLPGRDIGSARFLKQAEDYGIWLCRDTAAAVGLFIGVMARSQPIATMLSQAIFLPTVMLGGIMFPASMLPEPLRALGRLLPATYIMQSFSGLAFRLHADINPILSLLVTTAIGIVAAGLTVVRFRAIGKSL